MRIAVLVKQIPKFEEMELGADGRLRRDGIELELNPYCRRAVSQAVELAAQRPGSRVTVVTLGPPTADDALREAIAWGLERAVDIDGLLVTDPAFAGSDTLATAQALAATLEHAGPFDLVLTGRNSVDADTGQVGPELAELCDMPFLAGVRHLAIDGQVVSARCEHDDGWLQAEVHLPAILSCAERLIDPAKVDPPGRAAVGAARIRRLSAADLGPGPWGQAASPTSVGDVKSMAVTRARRRKPEAAVTAQVHEAVRMLHERGAFDNGAERGRAEVVGPARPDQPLTIVIAEPDRLHDTRELLGAAAALTGNVLAVTCDRPLPADLLSSWGADTVTSLEGDNIEEDVAARVVTLIEHVRGASGPSGAPPWAILTGSTAWGREVASRIAARLGAGLTGDAVDLEREGDRLVAWKPAFGGQLVAAIHCKSEIQMATVRAGVLPTRQPREPCGVTTLTVPTSGRGRVRVLARTRDDDLDLLAEAHTVIGIGKGVAPDAYDDLEPLRTLLDAQLGATRKVTDNGWLPRSRQIGITGRSIAPRLFVSIGASGKFNHTVGLRAAGTVLAINPDVSARIFDAADIGIVGDWREVVPLLVEQLKAARA
ncbi:MAG TPA: FAD-binding protein [Acidimicrobiia bacterium]|nr:FAD-binding protein [Acidimicrobiia bacterium]